MIARRRYDDTPPRANEGSPIDAEGVLRELAGRWASARTLEYRSEATLNHFGEWRIVVRIHTLLRRPSLARITFDADRPEMTRIRVCDGLRLFDFPKSTPLRSGRETSEAFTGKLTANVPHPLDDVSYCVDQFFASRPFVPAAGNTGNKPLRITGVRTTIPSKNGKPREALRLTLSREPSHDTLTLEPISLRPLELVRVGEHGGRVQEILRETFEDFRLGVNLPPSLFVWTPADARGATVP